MSCEKNEVNLISLSDDVLLHIFKYLNWIDSINLAATSKRMKIVKYWVNKQNQVFDLAKCVEGATVNIGNALPVIGPYIRVAKITEKVIRKSFMEKCCNIKLLEIDGCISQSVAITLNTWMKELKIDGLSIGLGFEDYVEDLLDGIGGLKKFEFNSFQKLLPSDFFEKNSSIQHLLLVLSNDNDLALDISSLQVLHSLQSLFVTTERTAVLNDVRKYVKMDRLKEFSIYFLESDWDAEIWGSFAEYLAKNTKLDKLKITGSIDIDEPIFHKLKLFNLTSLWVDVGFSWEDFSTALHESESPRLKYLKLEWPLSWCSSANIGYILKMWTAVEAICLNAYDQSDLLHRFNDKFFNDILEISDNRPVMKIHIFSSEVSFRKIF